LYSIQWQPQPLPVATRHQRGRWLVFADRTGDSQGILTRMHAAGFDCVRVSHGSSYVRRAAREFELDATNPEDYRLPLTAIDPVDGILHLWSAEVGKPIDVLDAERVSGSGVILNLVKALADSTLAAPRLWIATRTTQPVGGSIGVAHAPLWGLVRSLVH